MPHVDHNHLDVRLSGGPEWKEGDSTAWGLRRRFATAEITAERDPTLGHPSMHCAMGRNGQRTNVIRHQHPVTRLHRVTGGPAAVLAGCGENSAAKYRRKDPKISTPTSAL